MTMILTFIRFFTILPAHEQTLEMLADESRFPFGAETKIRVYGLAPVDL